MLLQPVCYKERMDREKILEDILKIVKDLTRDFDTDFSGGLGLQTHIVGDLGFESVDVVEMIVAIEEHYQRRDLPFQGLIMGGSRYHDFTIQDVVDFLSKYLTTVKEGSG